MTITSDSLNSVESPSLNYDLLISLRINISLCSVIEELALHQAFMFLILKLLFELGCFNNFTPDQLSFILSSRDFIIELSDHGLQIPNVILLFCDSGLQLSFEILGSAFVMASIEDFFATHL